MVLMSKKCKFFSKKDKGTCKASGKKCNCSANLWYCDYPTQRKEKENADNS